MIEYCKFHTEAKAKETSEDDAKNFDTEFVKVDQATLFELILVRTAPRVRALGRARSRTGRDEISPETCPFSCPNSHFFLSRSGPLSLTSPSRPAPPLALPLQAANYLNIKTLLDLTCMTVANMIKGKTPEEIRKTFNIKNDFTPEEEEEVRRENQWAFE